MRNEIPNLAKVVQIRDSLTEKWTSKVPMKTQTRLHSTPTILHAGLNPRPAAAMNIPQWMTKTKLEACQQQNIIWK